MYACRQSLGESTSTMENFGRLQNRTANTHTDSLGCAHIVQPGISQLTMGMLIFKRHNTEQEETLYWKIERERDRHTVYKRLSICLSPIDDTRRHGKKAERQKEKEKAMISVVSLLIKRRHTLSLCTHSRGERHFSLPLMEESVGHGHRQTIW